MATVSAEQPPEVVMRAELKQLFRVSNSRLTQLMNDDVRFPKPLADLIAGKVYRYADIEAYAEQTGRTLFPLDSAQQPGRNHPRARTARREP